LDSGGQIYTTTMQNVVEIGHMRYQVFFRFLRWPQSTILDFQIFKFLVADVVERSHTNFINISQMVAEIFHLTLSKWWPSAILDFFKFNFFEQLVSYGKLITYVLSYKIGQTVLEISSFLFSIWPTSARLDFKFFVDRQIAMPNIHRRTKFHQNRSIFWTARKLWRTNKMCHSAKFCQNRPNVLWYNVIFQLSIWPKSAILDFEIFGFPSGWEG